MAAGAYISGIWRVTRLLENYLAKAIHPVIKRYGLTVSQAELLCGVYKEKDTNIGAIAKKLGIARTNTSAMCKKLASMGFLHRARQKNDERVVSIALTDTGKIAAREIEAQIKTVCQNEEIASRLASLENAIQTLHGNLPEKE